MIDQHQILKYYVLLNNFKLSYISTGIVADTEFPLLTKLFGKVYLLSINSSNISKPLLKPDVDIYFNCI